MTDNDFELDRIAGLARDAAPARFDDGFTARVLERVRARRESPVGAALQRQFVRIVPLAAAATILLAGYNWWGAHAASASAIDAALNLPQVTLSSAYSPNALYDSASRTPEMP